MSKAQTSQTAAEPPVMNWNQDLFAGIRRPLEELEPLRGTQASDQTCHDEHIDKARLRLMISLMYRIEGQVVTIREWMESQQGT